MKTGIIETLLCLREYETLHLDHRNTDRYRILSLESDGTTTAYCFGAPIYNEETGKLLDLRFRKDGTDFSFQGSRASVKVSEEGIFLRDRYGECSLLMPLPSLTETDGELFADSLSVSPTLNGVSVRARLGQEPFTFLLRLSVPYKHIRFNHRSFSPLRENVVPFLTLSSVGTLNAEQKLIAPAGVEYQKESDTEYRITIHPGSPFGNYVLFECNLYEKKLFADTTVESKNPSTNNAFGGTAFLGKTDAFGEQWLYTRPDFGRFSDLTEHRIKKAVLHLPLLCEDPAPLTAYGIRARFCSFGSNWNNRIPETVPIAVSLLGKTHLSVDVTQLVTDEHRRLTYTDGWILKSSGISGEYAAVSTCDSSDHPLILEIQYK